MHPIQNTRPAARLPRRTFLQKTFGVAAMMVAAAFGLWKPRPTPAAEWPRDAYGAKTINDALRNLYGTSATMASAAVKIQAPSRVENGAVVAVSVSSDLPDVRAISILVEKNPEPLAAHINLIGGLAYFYVNIKMASTSNVHFIVNSDGKLYSATRNIRVHVSGYGS